MNSRAAWRLARLDSAVAVAGVASLPVATAPPSESFSVDEQTVEAFQRDGAVLIKGLLNTAQVQRLQAGIDENLASPGTFGAVASRGDDPGEFFEDFCNWDRIPAFQDIIFRTAIPRVAAQLMSSRTVRLFHDHLLVKEAGTVQHTPYHQDQPYYNIEGTQNVSFWLPVDPVPVESSLCFVSGSHTGRWYLPTTFLTETAKWFPKGTLEPVPDIDGDPSAFKLLQWAVEPGDALAFHMLCLHGSKGTTGRRRAFSVRVTGDDVVHAPRLWRTSPEFEGLQGELEAGAALDHPFFPLLWSSDKT